MKTTIATALFIYLCSISMFAQNDEARRHWVRAETAAKMGLFQDAINEYKEAIKLDPTNGSFYYNIALVEEKIGTGEMLTDAMKNYKEYLRLVPDCPDKEQVINKIYALEFQLDAQKKNVKQAENMKGIWRSDWHFDETGVPFWFFDIDLVDEDLRLTVLENSGLYRQDFTYKTVTLPYDKNAISFVFTNDTKHEAKNNDTEHAMVDILGSQNSSVSILSPLLHGLVSSSAEATYQTQCTYIFKLKIASDSLYGTVHIIEKRIDASSSKVFQDNVQYISFYKSNMNYPAMTKEQKEEKKRKKSKKEKTDLMGSLNFDYSIAQGSAASMDIKDPTSGFMTKGGGISVNFYSLPIYNNDTTLGLKRNKRLHICFGGGDSFHFYQIEAPYSLNIDKANSNGYAESISRNTSTTGPTKAFDIELGVQFGLFGNLFLSNKCFIDFGICPLGAAGNMIYTFKDKISGLMMLVNYNYSLNFGLNFLTKYRHANGVFISYSGGAPFAYLKDINIYALDKPKINISMLHIGYKYSF